MQMLKRCTDAGPDTSVVCGEAVRQLLEHVSIKLPQISDYFRQHVVPKLRHNMEVKNIALLTIATLNQTVSTKHRAYTCTLAVRVRSVFPLTVCFLHRPVKPYNVQQLHVSPSWLGPFHGAIAVSSVTRCRCRRRCRRCGHRTPPAL